MDRETAMSHDITNLSGLIDRIAQTVPDRKHICLDDVLSATGTRSLGPVLLLAGLVMLTPLLGDIPGVPTLMAMLVLLVASQLLFRDGPPWLPNWLLKRTVKRDTLYKALDWSRRPAGFVDRYTHIRLTHMVVGPGRYLIAVVCIAIALATPLMEVVPFSANGAGLALSIFGLALISQDGAFALVALIVVLCLFLFIGLSVL